MAYGKMFPLRPIQLFNLGLTIRLRKYLSNPQKNEEKQSSTLFVTEKKMRIEDLKKFESQPL